MEQHMKEIGAKINLMEKEKKYSSMVLNSKAFSKMVLRKKENSLGWMGHIMTGK